MACPYKLRGYLSADGAPYQAGGGLYTGAVRRILLVGLKSIVEISVHSFNLTNGSMPGIGMVQATEGNLYGTTTSGRPSACV